MTLLNKVTYGDKTNKIPIVEIQKQVSAENMNEIKSVLNGAVGLLNGIKWGYETLGVGVNTVSFEDAYETGETYLVLVHRCYGLDGEQMGHMLSSLTKNSFNVTVDKECTFIYLTAIASPVHSLLQGFRSLTGLEMVETEGLTVDGQEIDFSMLVAMQFSINGTTLWHNDYAIADGYFRISRDFGTTWGTPIPLSGNVATSNNVYTLNLPQYESIAERVLNATEGVDYPTGWTLEADGETGQNLKITHDLTLTEGIVQVTVKATDLTGTRVLVPFRDAYSGILENGSAITIEGLADNNLALTILLIFE